MARSADLLIDINEIDAGLHIGTVTVTGMRRFNLRMRLAVWLLAVVQWVAPVGLDIEEHRD